MNEMGSGCTLWKVMVDSLLGKSSKAGLHCLAENLLASWGERRDLQGIQLWDNNKVQGPSCESSLKAEQSYSIFSLQLYFNPHLAINSKSSVYSIQ